MRASGGKKGDAPLALVGKGVTFDSGGLSLKTPEQMKTMKCDMSGAATVLGAMQAIARLKLPLNAVGLVGLVENMTGGYAMNGWLYTVQGATVHVPEPQKYFKSDTQIQQTAKTPLFIDAVWPDIWPKAGDLPSRDLFEGAQSVNGGFLCRSTIARHGSRSPTQAPRNHPWTQPLPGAVDVSFTDGHAESVKLENLWQLYWHVNYVIPNKRPGL